MMLGDLSGETCSHSCTLACIAGATCVTGDDFKPTCLKSCTDQRDCANGGHCVELRSGMPAGRWCVDATTPLHCGPTCTVASAQRCDGSVAVHSISFAAAYCGNEYEFCARGCTNAQCNP